MRCRTTRYTEKESNGNEVINEIYATMSVHDVIEIDVLRNYHYGAGNYHYARRNYNDANSNHDNAS